MPQNDFGDLVQRQVAASLSGQYTGRAPVINRAPFGARSSNSLGTVQAARTRQQQSVRNQMQYNSLGGTATGQCDDRLPRPINCARNAPDDCKSVCHGVFFRDCEQDCQACHLTSCSPANQSAVVARRYNNDQTSGPSQALEAVEYQQRARSQNAAL